HALCIGSDTNNDTSSDSNDTTYSWYFPDIILVFQAQNPETRDETSLRLISRVSPNQTLDQNAEICCLHANILDFYLLNVLQSSDSFHPAMPRLKTDLRRISQDLSHHGCNVTHYQDHQNAVEFREKLITMQGQRGITKAIGEINILFTYLGDFCVQN
uniref:Uncharacterized LOC115542477 n=1 Tax=Gadus morhua TaxID=8049 RepID=A0A8C5FL63_GADMO